MPLLTDNALSFHLLNDARRAVVANTELTLNAGDRRFAFFGNKINRLVE